MDRPNLKGANVVVVGLGKSGEAAARFLLAQGARVTASDHRLSDAPDGNDLAERARRISDEGGLLELGGHGDETFASADLIVLSPGVPPTIPALVKARNKGVPVTGEIELAARYVDEPIVGVTGTNGKTTTTDLIGDIFKADGRKAFVGGNIGNPLIEYVRGGEKADVVVLELSSFQLETAEFLAPHVGALLNVTPDHLDRYADLMAYRDAKLKIFERQTAADFAVLNADDPLAIGAAVPSHRLVFSRYSPQTDGAFVRDGHIVLALGGAEIGRMPLSDLALVGAHNHENVMAALLCAMAMNVNPDAAFRAVAAYKGLPHRVQLVGECSGVKYYDDSKGTNVGAVIKSLEGFDEPVILIAGGRDKESDFRVLKPLVHAKVKLLLLLGEARFKMAEALDSETETRFVSDMAEAVSTAKSRAVSGDIVLLSPACASFDMFKSYAHRGDVFAGLVREVCA